MCYKLLRFCKAIKLKILEILVEWYSTIIIIPKKLNLNAEMTSNPTELRLSTHNTFVGHVSLVSLK